MKKSILFILVFFAAAAVIANWTESVFFQKHIFNPAAGLLNKAQEFFDYDNIYAPTGKATMKERIDLEASLIEILQKTPIVFAVRTFFPNHALVVDGTAFLIDEGTVATVNHALISSVTSEIFIREKWIKALPIGKVETKDLAFLKIPFDLKYRIEDMPGFKSAESIFYSFPKNANTVELQKIIVGIRCVNVWERKEDRIFIGMLQSWWPDTKELRFSTSSPVKYKEGCSGAPIFTLDGFIIGIVQSAIDSNVIGLDIKEVLEAADILKNR